MRTEVITRNLYKFEELTDSAKENALNNLRDINLHFNWWDCIYDDARIVGIKITGFDLDRRRHATIELIDSAYEVAVKITEEHGENCDTYKTAANFIADWDKLVKNHSDGIDTSKVAEENEYDFDKEAEELEQQFIKDIAEDYSLILQREYEYRYSDEAIIEAIEANDYEFTDHGKLA